jgi:hypothetical protein
MCAAAARALDRERAAVRGDPVSESGETGAAAHHCAPHPVILDAHVQRPVFAKCADGDFDGDACLTAFVTASHATK